MTLEENEGQIISFIAGDFTDADMQLDEKQLKETLPILPLRNTIVFPGSGIPISVGREKSIKLIKSLGKKQRYIGLVCQKDNSVENPEAEDLYKIGIIAEVLKVIELSENNFSIIVQAKKRFEWKNFTQTEPFFATTYKLLESVKPAKEDSEYDALLDSIREAMNSMLHMLGDPPKELLQTINNPAFKNIIVSYCATNLPIENREKQELLNIDDEKEMAYRLLMILNRENQILELKIISWYPK